MTEYWEIVHKIKIGNGEKEIKRIYDDVDALLIMEYLAGRSNVSLITESPSYKFIKSKKLESLFLDHPIVRSLKGAENGEELTEKLIELEIKESYRAYIRKVKEKLIKPEEEMLRAKRILEDIEREKYVLDLDLFRGLTILKDLASPSINIDEKSLITISKLSALLANSECLDLLYPLDPPREFLYFRWGKSRTENMSQDTVRSVTDFLSLVMHNPRNPNGILDTHLHAIFSFDLLSNLLNPKTRLEIDLSKKAVDYFNELYEKASKYGKFALLDKLFYVDPAGVSKYLNIQDSKMLCDSIEQKVYNLLNEFKGDELRIAFSILSSGLAFCYAASKNLSMARFYLPSPNVINRIDENKINVDDYEKLKFREYLEIWFLRPDPSEELKMLRHVLFKKLSQAYFMTGNIASAEIFAQEACKIAKELGEVKDMLRSCVLAYGINALKTGKVNIKDFEELLSTAEKEGLTNTFLQALAKTEGLISLAGKKLELVKEVVEGLKIGGYKFLIKAGDQYIILVMDKPLKGPRMLF